MTTSQIDAAAWTQQTAQSTSANAAAEGPNWAVALIGLGAVLNIGWIGLVAFVAAKLTIL